MKKILLSLLINLLTYSCFANEIVVITTLETNEGKRFWNSTKYSVYNKIEKHFQKNLLAEYNDIKFIHGASFKEILSELQNKKNKNIFFIGHGGIGNAQSGLSIESTIFDVNETPIQQLFFKSHKKLKFLAVVSCNSQKILKDTAISKNLSFQKSMTLIDFDSKIEIYNGINQAIDKYKQHTLMTKADQFQDVEEGDENEDEDKNIVKIKIRKELNFSNTSSLISIDNKTYGVMSGDLDQYEFNVSKTLLDKPSFTLEDDRGNLNSNHKINFGIITSLEIDGYECKVKPELNTKRELLGVTKHYYKIHCQKDIPRENLNFVGY